jgi:hypothetical protein
VADVGLEASERAAGADGHLVPPHAGGPGHPGRAGQLGQADRDLRVTRDRVLRGQDDPHRLGEQFVAFHARGKPDGVVPPLVAEHEVDVPEGQRRQRRLGLGLDDLAPELRRGAGQLGQGG